jgi:HEAT repeat protein
VGALGGIAPVVSEAVKDLARLLPDKELGAAAADGLTVAGRVAVAALVEAMHHKEWVVRNRAVFALARMSSFEDALPGLLAGLDHRDREVRQWALSVVLDMQGRGVPVAKDALVDALARRLADGDEEARESAAKALLNLPSAAARAKPALLKAVAEDRSDRVRHYAEQALKAIDRARAPER